MKYNITLLLLFCLPNLSSLFGQPLLVGNKLDSAFTLGKRVAKDRLDIGQHGVYFNEKTAQVLKDFNSFKKLNLVNLANFQQQVILDNENLVKIWTAKKPSEHLSTIIEINSVYLIDTTEHGHHRKDTMIFNDYFFIFEDSLKNVHYQSINGLGVRLYSIGLRQVTTNHEMIPVSLFYIDHTGKLKRLLNKYKQILSKKDIRNVVAFL